MKKIILLMFTVALSFSVNAQLVPKPKCDAFVVDILVGKVNDVRPDFSNGRVREALPCFTSFEEGADAKCGGIVSYKDKDIYFYTQRNYIEIGPKFPGKLSIPLMGAKRNDLFKWLGHPKLKDDDWDAFETAYGTLVLRYNKMGNVVLIQMTTKSTETLNICQ